MFLATKFAEVLEIGPGTEKVKMEVKKGDKVGEVIFSKDALL